MILVTDFWVKTIAQSETTGTHDFDWHLWNSHTVRTLTDRILTGQANEAALKGLDSSHEQYVKCAC